MMYLGSIRRRTWGVQKIIQNDSTKVKQTKKNSAFKSLYNIYIATRCATVTASNGSYLKGLPEGPAWSSENRNAINSDFVSATNKKSTTPASIQHPLPPKGTGVVERLGTIMAKRYF